MRIRVCKGAPRLYVLDRPQRRRSATLTHPIQVGSESWVAMVLLLYAAHEQFVVLLGERREVLEIGKKEEKEEAGG